MNDQDEIWNIRRGRPKKLMHDECLRLNAFFQQSLPPNEHAYRAAKTRYLNEIFSIKTENLIRETLALADVPLKDKHLPLFFIAHEGVKQMLASDIEIIVFSVIFLSHDLAYLTIPLEEYVKICIFIAKLQIENNFELIAIIKSHLEKEISDFQSKVDYFDQGARITTKDIIRWNKRLNNVHESCINYSYYVDDILLKAPPYKITEKVSKRPLKKKVKKTYRERKIVKKVKISLENEAKSGENNSLGANNCNEINEVEVTTVNFEDFDQYWWLQKDKEYDLEDLE